MGKTTIAMAKSMDTNKLVLLRVALEPKPAPKAPGELVPLLNRKLKFVMVKITIVMVTWMSH